MQHSPSSPHHADQQAPLEVGTAVRTPSGAYARVVDFRWNLGHWEVTVEWPGGDRADFRMSKLRAI